MSKLRDNSVSFYPGLVVVVSRESVGSADEWPGVTVEGYSGTRLTKHHVLSCPSLVLSIHCPDH